MHRRAIMALAAFALALGASAYAAEGTDSTDRTGTSSVSGENTTPSTGRTGSGEMGSREMRVDRSVDTTRTDDRRHMDVSRTGDVDDDADRSGARTGGYLAAGIGIAALIGLFASRRNRTRTTRRGSRYDVDDDDFNRPSGVGPRV